MRKKDFLPADTVGCYSVQVIFPEAISQCAPVQTEHPCCMGNISITFLQYKFEQGFFKLPQEQIVDINGVMTVEIFKVTLKGMSNVIAETVIISS